MKTEVLKLATSILHDKSALKKELADAAELILAGECVAFPTETVYGLGALALNPAAIAKIYQAKGRPNDNPLIAHVNSIAELSLLVEPLSPLKKDLIQLFSPGPITYVLKKQPSVPDALTAGLDTVAVRIPAKAVARALIALCEAPIAAPSANLSGMPSPTSAEHVLHDLEGKIPLIIDGGTCEVGLESTVLDLSDEQDIKILRPGAVTAERLIRFLESRRDFEPRYENWRQRLAADHQIATAGEVPRAPGMKYRHYAPDAPVFVLRGESIAEKALAFGDLLQEKNADSRFGLYVSDDLAYQIMERHGERMLNSGMLVFEHSFDGSVAAQHLFAALRELDEQEPDLIVVEALSHSEVGAAYMNRLEKASSNKAKIAVDDKSKQITAEPVPKPQILFVCTGNTCRSPMAEGLFNHVAIAGTLPWWAESAGLAALEGDEISPLAAAVLKNVYGIDMTRHRAQRLTDEKLKHAHLILTMTGGQAAALRSSAPEHTKKISSLSEYLNQRMPRAAFTDVKDPYGGDEQTYASCAAQISSMIEHLTDALTSQKAGAERSGS